MTKTKYEKELRPFNVNFRAVENTDNKMILEGYPIVFEKETLIGDAKRGFIEIIDKHAFDGADLSDVCGRYNHSDNFLILCRTRNKSLELLPDENGVFTRWQLIDTTTNNDVYKMARAGLLSQGSFAFTVADQDITFRDGMKVRRIKKVGKCFDVSVVDTPAYESTSIYARSLELAEAWEKPPEGEGKPNKRNYKLETLLKKYGGK